MAIDRRRDLGFLPRSDRPRIECNQELFDCLRNYCRCAPILLVGELRDLLPSGASLI